MFVVLALVIGMFERGYQQMQAGRKVQQRLKEYAGLLAAFVLLDLNRTERIGRRVFVNFVVSQGIGERVTLHLLLG